MTPTLTRSRRMTAALAVLCGVLGTVDYVLATRAVRLPEPVVVAAVSRGAGDAGKGDGMPARFPPIDAYRDLVARPLFNPSRRPVAVALPAAEGPVVLDIMLSGVVIDSTQQVAHLKSLSDRRVQALRVGDRIGKWQIDSIRPDHVVLRAGNQVSTVYMKKFGLESDTPAGANASRRSSPQTRYPVDGRRAR